MQDKIFIVRIDHGTTVQMIQDHPVYQAVLKDSFGGIMYNVANHDKYDAAEIIQMWNGLSPAIKESAGGIMKGVFNFLTGK